MIGIAAHPSAASQAAPGVLGFLVVAGMGLILFFLFRSMAKHLRKVSVTTLPVSGGLTSAGMVSTGSPASDQRANMPALSGPVTGGPVTGEAAGSRPAGSRPPAAAEATLDDGPAASS